MKNSYTPKKESDFEIPFINSNNSTKNESKGLIYTAIAIALFGFSNFQMKLSRMWFPDTFDESSYIILRSAPICLISYYFIKQNNEEILNFNKIHNKFWFIIRMISNFFSTFFYLPAVIYLRAATASTILSMYPIISLILAVFILKEKFHLRYLVFTFIGFLCSFMMIINDKNNEASKSSEININIDSDSDASIIFGIVIGSIYAILAMFMVSLIVTTTKILINDRIDFRNQMFYIGLSNTVLGCFSALLMFRINVNIFFILAGFMNSATFYFALYYMTVGLENVDSAKTSPLAYIGIIVNFVLGAVILGEPVFVTDVIGSLMIVGCNVYYSMINKNK